MQGVVRLVVGGEIVVAKYGELIDDVLEEPLYCPRCGRTTGLTLVARGREAYLECAEGHRWTDPEVAACGVRQLLHLGEQGAQAQFPGATVRVDMLPRITEDRTLHPPPPHAPERQLRWEGLVLTTTGIPALTDCLHWARRLCVWAVPTDGDVYEWLYPPAGGNALDAHMTVVLVALALYAACAEEELPRCDQVSLEGALDQLPGDDLRRLRPTGVAGLGGRLRVSDVHRLATASQETFERWRRAAHRVIEVNQGDQHGVQLADRNRQLLTLADDLTWYAGQP
ncbi:hypothetical protein ACIRVK_32270 [Streptomyces sp. NPDC101152]|uniref:hypothetical protein n=1 Tax=Streptomyces sp. NPDC101152 TaxID=3366116 RepID=UPI0037FA6797